MLWWKTYILNGKGKLCGNLAECHWIWAWVRELGKLKQQVKILVAYGLSYPREADLLQIYLWLVGTTLSNACFIHRTLISWWSKVLLLLFITCLTHHWIGNCQRMTEHVPVYLHFTEKIRCKWCSQKCGSSILLQWVETYYSQQDCLLNDSCH